MTDARTAKGDAPGTVALAGGRAAWERRAEWLEAEARAQREPSARGRLLLAASEVRALLGARAEARRLALQAQQQEAAPPLAARQARALHQTHGDVGALARCLAEEAASASTAAGRAHAHVVASEVRRLLLRDAEGARACLAAAEAADPSDRRAPLGRLLLELEQTLGPPERRELAGDDLRPLAHARDTLAQLRGDPVPGDGELPVPLAFLALQRALSLEHLEAAADAVERLRLGDGAAGAIAWLGAAWRAAARGPERAVELFRALVRAHPERDARRALALRALAAGQPAALREALGAEEASDGASSALAAAFSPSERAALAVLSEGHPDVSAPEGAGATALSSAVARALGAPPPGPRGGDDGWLELELGRAAGTQERLSELTLERPAAEPWALVLQLEQHQERADLAALARELPALFDSPVAAAEASFVAAAVAERAGDARAARELLEGALRAPLTREAATRALADATSEGEGAASFRALSAHAEEPLRRALALTEAALRLPPSAAEFDAVAEEAARAFPALPLALELGEIGAWQRGDRSRIARWLARRRELARGSDEVALASSREALLLLEVDREAALQRLRELAARDDAPLSVRLECERWLAPPAAERARLRVAWAPALGQRGRQHFLAEAVLLHELDGSHAAARSAARALGGALGERWAERCADREPQSLTATGALRALDPEGAAERCARRARRAAAHGRGDEARAGYEALLAIEPGSLEALRSLATMAAREGAEDELAGRSLALAEQLPDAIALAHCCVAAELAGARGEPRQAAAAVRRALGAASAPRWALRRGAALALEAGDDATLLEVCSALRERARLPLDAAALSLHAAQAAARLGDLGRAKRASSRALELAPDDIVAASIHAELLLASGDSQRAAEAYEALAAATRSPARRADALHQAALLWLDRLGQRARGMLALAEAASSGVPHDALLERLLELRASSQSLDGLDELIERQRTAIARRDAELEGALEQALAGGAPDAALELLDALIERRPRDGALRRSSAVLALASGDAAGAERELRRAIELDDSPPARLAALLALFELYSGPLPRPDALMEVAAEILRRDPGRAAVRQRLVALLAERGRLAEALEHQRELAARAPDDEALEDALLGWIRLAEAEPTAAAEVEALLERARRTWPDDPRVLEADVTHQRRRGDLRAASVIAARGAGRARAAIEAGRVDPAPLRLLEAAARLQGDEALASLARAMVAAVGRGARSGLEGAGAPAVSAELEGLLAPEPLGDELRRLLVAGGAALERAYAGDATALAARPADPAAAAELLAVGRAAGVDAERVLVSPELGCDCVWLGGLGSGARVLLVGRSLLERDDRRLLEFLVLRAAKLVRVNAVALSRMSSAEQRSALGGFLACFAPAPAVGGAEAQRLIAARNKILPHVTLVPERGLAESVAAVMADVLPRAELLSEALGVWATRVALLAVGDPAVALSGLWARRHPDKPPPKTLDARMRWIASEAEARDLVRFGVSEPYMEARRRAGLPVSSP